MNQSVSISTDSIIVILTPGPNSFMGRIIESNVGTEEADRLITMDQFTKNLALSNINRYSRYVTVLRSPKFVHCTKNLMKTNIQ